MSVEFWDKVPIIILYFGIVCFIVIFFEIGYQIGKYTRSHYERHADTSPGPMVAAILTMLAFLLAIMFSMTASRFDNRKQLVIEEVNAINTAFTQADLIAQPHSSQIKHLLREYVDVRLQTIKEKNVKAGIERSEVLQEKMWAIATTVSKNDPVLLNTIFLQSINEVMDVHSKRVNAALRDRIPSSIWITLIVIIALSMITLGSQTGLVKTRRLIQVIPMVFAFSALMTVIVDLDRPSEFGLIRVSQDAMFDLQESMNRTNK